MAVIPITTSVPIDDRLYIATRAWLLWLQGLFSTKPIGMYRWTSDPDTTEIMITDQEPIGAAVTNKRPVIVSKRNGAGYASLGVGQVMMANYGNHDLRMSDLVNCSLTLTIIAREGIEAQSIAYEIFRMIPLFRGMIIRLGRMHSVGPQIQLGAEYPYKALNAGSSTPEWKAVSLSIPFSVQDTFTMTDSEIHTFIESVNMTITDIGKFTIKDT